MLTNRYFALLLCRQAKEKQIYSACLYFFYNYLCNLLLINKVCKQ